MLPSILRRLTPVALALALQFGAAPAGASPVTLHFSGEIDLSSTGGAAVNMFWGFVTWDPSASPFEDDGAGSATYDVLAYSLTFNDVDVTLPIIGNGTGQGVAVVNDVDALEAGVFIDGLFFFAAIPAGVSGLDRMLIAALTGPLDMFTDITLPADLTFLSQTTQRSLVLEGPDDDEVLAAVGSLIATGALDVPEPMSVALLAFGLAATLVRVRGPRRFTKSC